MFEIDKNIPMPEETKEKKRGIYPFSDMEIGDSFFCNFSKGRIMNAACVAGYRQEKRFKVIKVDGGFRVWRIA